MQRGIRTFQNLLFSESPIAAVAEKKQIGRDPVLVDRRNKLIAHRYYYYVKIVRKNYPDTMQAIQDEFFLSDIQISRIIDSSAKELQQLRQTTPDIKYFMRLYPHMVW